MALTRDDLAMIAQLIAQSQPPPKPPTLQRIYFSKAVGDNQSGGIGGMEPGFLIRGVTVDNPSGSWVLLQPTNQFIAPFTFGWSSTLLPGSQVISASYVIGPTGQAISTFGQPAVSTSIQIRLRIVPVASSIHSLRALH